MSVQREKLKKFQEQHLESQVQCGEHMKSVPKAACVKEWALVEIALNLQTLNENLAKLIAQQGGEGLAGTVTGLRHDADESLPRS